MRSLSLPDLVLKRSRFDLGGRLQEFVPQLAIVEPDERDRSLTLQFTGSGLLPYFERDPTGRNYLELVEPATRESAFSSAMAMVNSACGLWQLTPMETDRGQTTFVEYTAFPLLRDGDNNCQIVVYVHRSPLWGGSMPRLLTARQSSQWEWIDLGQGTPTHIAQAS